jgi:hypothetical protein
MHSFLARGGRVPLQPPPADRLSDRLRRRLRALGAYTGLRHWLLVRGTAILGVVGLLYVVNGMANGWTTAYDVAIGITSPGDPALPVPALAWPLSMAGWLAAPAIFGAVAGVAVSKAIADRRQRPIADVLRKPGGPHA